MTGLIGNRLSLIHTLGVLFAAATDVNATGARPDVPGEVWPEGELPAQFGTQGPTLMPGTDTFRIPMELPQLWDNVAIKVNRPGHKDHDQTILRLRLKFDREHPLVIIDGPRKDEPLTATFTSNPRPRGKKDDPTTPWVSDLAYMLDIGLGDKSRPTTPEGLKAAINRFAGKTMRLEHGLSAQCRPDKVRYVQLPDGSVVVDPQGVLGCGQRFYTKDFKDASAPGGFVDEIACDCGAALRGYAQHERFVPAQGAQAGAAPVAGGVVPAGGSSVGRV